MCRIMTKIKLERNLIWERKQQKIIYKEIVQEDYEVIAKMIKNK